MKHIIDKSFSFCYGHRVHNQRLDTRFTESGDACLACRHLHGHEGLIKIFLEEIITGKNIGETGMVTDFKHLGWAKNFIDDVLDHKMILDIKDPLLPHEVPEYCRSYHVSGTPVMPTVELDFAKCIKQPEGYWVPNLEYLPKNTIQAVMEKYEGMVFVDFVPTSENLAAWLMTIAAKKMEGIPNVRVCAVEYWETPKSHCRVEA